MGDDGAGESKLRYVSALRYVASGDELRYVMHMFSAGAAVVARDIAIAIRVGRNTVPDKSKIKDDITES